MEQLSYNLLFRWFVGMEMDEPVWNRAVFSKNRKRLLNQDVVRAFFAHVLGQAKPRLSDERPQLDSGGYVFGWVGDGKCLRRLVDLVRFELTTSSMPWKRAPNCATGPRGYAISTTCLSV